VENFRNIASAVQVGAFTNVRGRLLTFAHAGAISLGQYCYVGERTEIWSQSLIKIGDRVLISHSVNISDGTSHSRDPEERHQHLRAILESGHPRTVQELPGVEGAPVTIEDDVWINYGVTILKGVTIGARSIIAANSIVTKDVPPDSLYRMSVSPIITPLVQR
jgi:maltose O-acetyltransferase